VAWRKQSTHPSNPASLRNSSFEGRQARLAGPGRGFSKYFNTFGRLFLFLSSSASHSLKKASCTIQFIPSASLPKDYESSTFVLFLLQRVSFHKWYRLLLPKRMWYWASRGTEAISSRPTACTGPLEDTVILATVRPRFEG
jgi:hypothetical protein